MILARRRFLFAGAALVAAPAIVRVASLMPVSVPKPALYEFKPRLYTAGTWHAQSIITIRGLDEWGLKVEEVLELNPNGSYGPTKQTMRLFQGVDMTIPAPAETVSFAVEKVERNAPTVVVFEHVSDGFRFGEVRKIQPPVKHDKTDAGIESA